MATASGADSHGRQADNGVRRGERGSPWLWPAARAYSQGRGSAAGGVV